MSDDKVSGISKEDYQAWRHQAVTKVILQFLADKQSFIKTAALEQWVNGADTFTSSNQTVRGQIIELQEIIDLPFEAVVEFYQSQEESNEPSTESPFSPSR